MLPVAILAGGLATRLRPITEKVPKSLIEVNGEPFAIHQLRLLKENGIRRVVFCVGYLGEMIQDVIGNGARFGIEVEYSFDGPSLLGTAGAVRNALPKLGGQFFVVYGDSYLPCNYAAVADGFASKDSLAMMTVFHNNGKWDMSNVEFSQGNILSYNKVDRTPRMRFIDYGLGAFRAAAFHDLPAGQVHDLAQLYQDLLQRKQLAAFEVHERFYEIGSPEGLEETSRFLAAQRVSLK